MQVLQQNRSGIILPLQWQCFVANSRTKNIGHLIYPISTQSTIILWYEPKIVYMAVFERLKLHKRATFYRGILSSGINLYSIPPLIRTSLLLNNSVLIREVHAVFAAKNLSFLERCPLYKVSFKRGTTVHQDMMCVKTKTWLGWS